MVTDETSIGARLQQAREAAGLAPEDVQFRTRLPKAVIVALEAEDFADFVSPVYARSFLSQYSDFLGVDADRWLDALEPGGLVSDDSIGRLVEAPDDVEERPIPHERPTSRGGMLAMPLLLLLSVALIALAVKGYDYFEAKFRSDSPPAAETGALHAPDQQFPPRQPAPEPAPEAVAEHEEEAAKPPPRAIIVR